MNLLLMDKVFSEYNTTFYGKDGNQYGFRFGNPQDAKQLVKIFEDVYGWEYLYPKVYDIKLLEKSISLFKIKK